MSYSYRFSDNATYGAEDVNGLVKSLVSEGIADVFADGVSYNAGILNSVVSAVYTEGVVPTDVSTLAVSKMRSGVVQIAPGTAFFADGSTISVTAAEELSYVPGSKHYVYVQQDLTAQNRNYPACTETAPTGDFVLLAEITEDESIVDKRRYAKGKVPGYQSNANVSLAASQSLSFEKGGERQKSFTVDLGTNNYSRVFVVAKDGNYGSVGMYNFLDGSYFSTYNVGYRAFWQASTEHVVVVPQYAEGGNAVMAALTFSKNGNVVTGQFEHGDEKSASYSFTMIFC